MCTQLQNKYILVLLFIPTLILYICYALNADFSNFRLNVWIGREKAASLWSKGKNLTPFWAQNEQSTWFGKEETSVELGNGNLATSASGATENEEPPIILMYTKVWGQHPDMDTTKNCPLNCTYTLNKSQFNKAEVVVFSAPDVGSTRPTPANAEQKYVFYTREAGWFLNGFTKGRWWKGNYPFHWVMGHSTKAHSRMLYGYYLVEPQGGERRHFQVIANFSREQVFVDKKTKGAVWFVSNCGSLERKRVAHALERHFHVDIGGNCGNRSLCPKINNNFCPELIRQYYFYLAFENANCMDYMTEKMIKTLDIPVVPIVMKRSVYKNVIPSEAFIAVDDFENVQKLAEHLQYLIDNPDEYFKLFEWRRKWTKAEMNADGYLQGYCHLCARILRERHTISPPILDMKQWFQENGPCEKAVNETWFN